MSEIVPSFGEYRHDQTHKAFRAIGRYLVDSLIKAGECLSMKAPITENSISNPITNSEIIDFVSQSDTIQFDRELATLIREYPID